MSHALEFSEQSGKIPNHYAMNSAREDWNCAGLHLSGSSQTSLQCKSQACLQLLDSGMKNLLEKHTESRWDAHGGSSRRTWLAIAGKINEDLHREIILTEADYAWDHLFSGISLQMEQSIHHMQPHLTSYQSILLTKTLSFFPDPWFTMEIVWVVSTLAG